LEEVYLDETFIWQNVGRQWSWFPNDEPSAAIAAKANKGDRWSVIHAGGAHGWVPGVMFLRKVDRSGDYHGTIDAEHFTDWFTNWLLPALKKPSLIIMDNASFHRKQDTTIKSLGVAALRDRLRKHGIAFEEKALRDDLVALVKERCDIRPRVERIARRAGQRVLWLPPYHPDLNPIERMWGVAKNSVRAQFTIDPVDYDGFIARLNEGFGKCDEDVWHGAVEKSWKAAKSYVNFEQVMLDAAVADAQPEPVYSDDDDDSDEKNTEIAAAAAVDHGSDGKRAPVAAAHGPAHAAGQAEAVAPLPSRRSHRKRAPARKVLENADDSDSAPRRRARKGTSSSAS
jgi:transposase